MKYFELTQNNSFGDWEFDNNICHRMIVEADSEDQAFSILTQLGVPFCNESGKFADYDDCGCCPCCGHRWSESLSELIFPMKWYENTLNNIDDYFHQIYDVSKFSTWTSPDARVFNSKGEIIKEYGFKKVKK